MRVLQERERERERERELGTSLYVPSSLFSVSRVPRILYDRGLPTKTARESSMGQMRGTETLSDDNAQLTKYTYKGHGCMRYMV